MNTRTEEFWRWAERELEAQNLSWYALERCTGLSNAAISRRARELLPPTFDTCMAIARGMNLSPVVTLRKAGLLPPVTLDEEEREELEFHYDALNGGDRRKIMDIVRMFHESSARYNTDEEK